MTEPNYTYVKGKGWIIQPDLVFITRDKVTVRLVDKRPDDYDKWFLVPRNPDHVFNNTYRWYVNGQLDNERLRKHLGKHDYKTWAQWNSFYKKYYPADQYIIFVLEKLEPVSGQ